MAKAERNCNRGSFNERFPSQSWSTENSSDIFAVQTNDVCKSSLGERKGDMFLVWTTLPKNHLKTHSRVSNYLDTHQNFVNQMEQVLGTL